MNETKRKMLKPKDGLKVRNPKTGKHLESKGESVAMNSYWLRRISEGSVVVVKEESKSLTIKNKEK